jgi:hypothetical protein
MKNIIILILSMTLVLIILGLPACGGNNQLSQTPSSSQSSTKTSTASSVAATQSQSSGSGLNWDDMPVYSGASNVQKGSWSVPPSEDEEYSHYEWRYYEANASNADVAAFYKSKMPSIGWKEMGWMDMQGTSWGMYNKNDEKDAAMIWVSTQDKKTVIGMWRGTK